VVFGVFAGVAYWFPKAFGFRLNEAWGVAAFWLTLAAFYAVFVPLYMLGLLGMTRRMQHYDIEMWRPWVLAAMVGIGLFTLALICQVIQLVVSIRQRDQLRDETGDPWNGRTLEWATPSPPPKFNFALQPNVLGEEPYWQIKQRAIANQQNDERYEAIMAPRNNATGFVTGFFATVTGFAMVWRIWWLAVLGLAAAYVVFVWYAWRDIPEEEISADEVARVDRAHRKRRAERFAQDSERGETA
jgi:cytochrome o ubiquinol oxidase subunit 1